MKLLLYIFYILLALPVFSSCQMGTVDSATAQEMISGHDARIASCASHSYATKEGETVVMGPARGDIILVGFSPELTLEERQQLVKPFPHVAAIEGEVNMDSGPITRVSLKPGSTCFEAWKTIKAVKKLSEVRFAAPTFNPSAQDAGTYEWVGQTNEFLVYLHDGTSPDSLTQLAQQTNTQIVFSLSDEVHIMSAEKAAVGNMLEMVTLFNSKSFVAGAEPNFVYFLNPVQVETGVQKSTILKKKKN